MAHDLIRSRGARLWLAAAAVVAAVAVATGAGYAATTDTPPTPAGRWPERTSTPGSVGGGAGGRASPGRHSPTGPQESHVGPRHRRLPGRARAVAPRSNPATVAVLRRRPHGLTRSLAGLDGAATTAGGPTFHASRQAARNRSAQVGQHLVRRPLAGLHGPLHVGAPHVRGLGRAHLIGPDRAATAPRRSASSRSGPRLAL